MDLLSQFYQKTKILDVVWQANSQDVDLLQKMSAMVDYVVEIGTS